VSQGVGATSRRDYRIVVVDDHALFRESLELTLTIEGYDVRTVLVPEDDRDDGSLLARVLRQRPRLVLLDLDLGPWGDGVALVEPLARSGVDVVVLTAVADRSRWGEAARCGARKVLSKAAPLRDCLAVVRRLQQGMAVTTVEERENLIRHFMDERAHAHELRRRISGLTAREAQVLGQLMLGRTVREIAAGWRVSEATVRTQVKSILAKLGVTSQLAAVGLAHKVGWRPPQLTT
jgi:two-component system, NarL family, nitrate/nitrite response regulator NarL